MTPWPAISQGVGDFDGDRRSDILWRATNGQLAVWGSGDAKSGLVSTPDLEP